MNLSKKAMSYIKDKKFKVVRITKNEFELEDGSIYPIPFELESELTIEEFQKYLDNSKNLLLELLSNG